LGYTPLDCSAAETNKDRLSLISAVENVGRRKAISKVDRTDAFGIWCGYGAPSNLVQ
jgi:hypothetical protein